MRLASSVASILLALCVWAGCAGAAGSPSSLAGAVDPLSIMGRAGGARGTAVEVWTGSGERGEAGRAAGAGIDAASYAMLASDRGSDRAIRVKPGIAFLMSGVVPGTGQLAEGRNRAFVYLGLEALAWITHFSWLDAGNKKEGEYESYARKHWSLDQWNALASESSEACRALPPGISYEDAKTTIEGFLEAGNYQHYYEDIGKLEAYRSGWDDFSCTSPDIMSPDRVHYRGMREDSNNYLNKARSALTFAFLNHIVSAIDAYRTAKGAQLRLPGGAEVKMNLGGSMEHPRVGLRVAREW